MGPERYLEVRYEELVDAPERQLRAICQFIGLDFRDEMLGFYERASEVVAVTNPGQHQHLFHPVQSGLRDWSTQMSAEDVAMFESLAGDVLDELGYERMFRRPPVRARVRAWRWRLADPDARRLRRWRDRARAAAR